MKGIFLSIIILIGCLCFSACSEQNANESSTASPISIDSSNENTDYDSDSESVLSSTADGSQIESHISSSDTDEEQPSNTSQNDEEYYKIHASFDWGGTGETQQRKIVLSCPTNWEAYDGRIDLNGKKLVELVCYSPTRMENKLERLEKAEQKEIGGKNFWLLSEEYSILEKPKQVPYTIWRYYYFDGELYYGISFFQNQEDIVITLEEFEEVLATMEIEKN